MDIKMVLFDLDGTLLPMNQDEYPRGGFERLIDYIINENVRGSMAVKEESR